MARGFGTSEGGTGSDRIVTAFNGSSQLRTYSLWVYFTISIATNDRLLNKDNETLIWHTSSNRFSLLHYWSGADLRYEWTKPSVNNWFHMLVTYDNGSNSNAPSMYYDNVLQTPSRTDSPSGTADANTNNFCIGNTPAGNRTLDGRLAEVAIWDRILSAEERKALSNGFSPQFFRHGLKMYYPLIREAKDHYNGAPTVAGTTVKDHPPGIIYPVRHLDIGFPVASSPPSPEFNPAWAMLANQ